MCDIYGFSEQRSGSEASLPPDGRLFFPSYVTLREHHGQGEDDVSTISDKTIVTDPSPSSSPLIYLGNFWICHRIL